MPITTRFDVQVKAGDHIRYRSKVDPTWHTAKVVKGNWLVTMEDGEQIERIVIAAPLINLTLTANSYVIEELGS